MTEAGWYRGEGDPPGTQRYWDGNVWIGDPVYEPPATPMPPPPLPPSPAGYAHSYAYPVVASSTFPSGLKIVAIVVTVLKAIPLAFGLLGASVLALFATSYDDGYDDFSYGLDGLLNAAIAFLFAGLVIGGLLLGFQFAGAVKERPIMLFVPALILTILDVLFTIGAWSSYNDARNSSYSDDSAGGVVLMVTLTAAQAFVAVQAIRANSN